MISAHAHGKVILLGEHAVVYGHPALAAAVSPGVDATAAPHDTLSLTISPWNTTYAPRDGTDLGRALAILATVLAVPSGSVHATMHLPGGGGLGSSAALGVATARALMALHGQPTSDDAVLRAAFAWEKVFHGNPSGIDHTLATVGGIGVFTRSEGLARRSLRAPLRLVLADSGERSRTVDMVARIATLLGSHPASTEASMGTIATLVRSAAVALADDDLPALGHLMDRNHFLLASLGVSTDRIDALCATARSAGALGAKLTGAGGGGCVLAITSHPTAEDSVRAAWATMGARTFVFEVCA